MIMSLRPGGYVVAALKLDSSLHGSVQQSLRLYIIAWYVGRVTHDDVALQDAAERLEEKLRVEPRRLPKVLLQEPSDCTVASKSHGQELR